jgi:hypothetical protein
LEILNKTISEFLLDKFGLSAELTTNIFTIIAIFFGSVATYGWIVRINYLWIIFISIASIGTICLDIWFRYKSIFPKFKTSKVKKIRYVIYGNALLLAMAQSGALSILIIEGIAKIPDIKVPSYFEEYRIIAIIFYEIIAPILYFYFSKKISLEIGNNNKRSWKIIEDLGWR